MPEADQPGIVDWGLASRVARRMAGSEPSALDQAAVTEVCAEGLERALAYSTLKPTEPIPPPELVSRSEWIDSNLAELMKLVTPLEERLAAELALPGPIEPVAKRFLSATGGTEAGVVLGYASKRVLGQYQVSLRPEPDEPRLLLVGANLSASAEKLEVEPEPFLRWVAIHEQTHSIQFHSVSWLREYLAGLVSEMLGVASGGLDIRQIFSRAKDLVVPDPRAGLRRVLRGELSRIFAGPEQGRIMDRVQAAMAVVEGYAEHVMDEASSDVDELAEMRTRMDARRAQRAGLTDLIARVLGLGAKLRQYELGKKWCDAVAAETGIAGLDRVWESPESLPTLAELEDAEAWIGRVSSPTTA